MRVEDKTNDIITIQEIMTKELNFAHPGISIAEVAKIMQLQNCTMLPVGNEYRIQGVITDRDIVVRVIAQSKDPHETLAGDIMSKEVFSCSEHDSLENAIIEMNKHKITSLIVKNYNNKIVGIVFLKNIIRNIVCERSQAGCIRHYLTTIT